MDLINIYDEYEQAGSGTFTPSQAGAIQFKGTSVGVDVSSSGGDLSSLVSAMTALGMHVTAHSSTDGIVEGYLPIAELLPAAQNSQVLSISPMFVPLNN